MFREEYFVRRKKKCRYLQNACKELLRWRFSIANFSKAKNKFEITEGQEKQKLHFAMAILLLLTMNYLNKILYNIQHFVLVIKTEVRRKNPNSWVKKRRETEKDEVNHSNLLDIEY